MTIEDEMINRNYVDPEKELSEKYPQLMRFIQSVGKYDEIDVRLSLAEQMIRKLWERVDILALNKQDKMYG